jgi:hypothetical protein
VPYPTRITVLFSTLSFGLNPSSGVDHAIKSACDENRNITSGLAWMYHIRHAGAKGLGVFAAKPIPRGTRILAEKPIFTLKSERDLFAATRALLPSDLQALKELSVNEQHPPGSTLQEWLRMIWHVIQGSRAARSGLPTLSTLREYQPILAAFRNNNFDIGDNRQAVFREISRVNHACVPNTQGNFNTNINAFTIHSLRPIEAEEEITVSYLEMFATTREIRQSALYRGYGFECTCPACDMTKKRARDGERKRVMLKERLYSMHQLQKEGGKRDHNAEMELLKELIKFSETEGLAGRELGTM